jgi:hypothetical protein
MKNVTEYFIMGLIIKKPKVLWQDSKNFRIIPKQLPKTNGEILLGKVTQSYFYKHTYSGG